MATAAVCETVMLKTPQGHDVLAELDYAQFGVRRAKVVHNFTGVTKALDAGMIEDLARALRAKQLYEHAQQETRSVEETLKRFGNSAQLLGQQHPAMAPYFTEVAQHRAIARDMGERARHFHDHAMRAIDKLADSGF